MRTLLVGAAGLGLALLALSVFHRTTVGSCGSGSGRYGTQVAGPCPSNTGEWIGALVGSILVAIVATALAGRLLGPAFALALAIPGPIREPKHVTFAQIENVAAESPQSWCQPAKLRGALQTVTAKLGPGAGITSIPLKPGIAVVNAVSGDTRHSFSRRYGGAVDDFTSAASGDDKTVRIATIDTTAPQRLLAQLRALRRQGAGLIGHALRFVPDETRLDIAPPPREIRLARWRTAAGAPGRHGSRCLAPPSWSSACSITIDFDPSRPTTIQTQAA